MTPQFSNPAELVAAWQDAVNAGDADLLADLSDPDIEIVGPRGSGFGRDLLRGWLARAGLSLTPLRVFARGESVVVAQRGIWRSPDSGEVQGEAEVASSFRVRGGRVTRFARFDDLSAALADANLTEADEVRA